MSLTIYVTDAKNICYQRPKSAFFDAKSWVISPLSNSHKLQNADYQTLTKSSKNGHISNHLQSFLKKRLKIGGKFRKFTTKQEQAPSMIKWNEFIQIIYREQKKGVHHS